MYKCDKSTEVTILVNGKERKTKIGIATTFDNRQIFGLCEFFDEDILSHLCYGLEYFSPKEAVDRKFPVFYFYMGSPIENSIAIKRDELERGFKELGLLEDEH